MKVTRVGTVRCLMGEGPLWDVAEQALFFVDVFGKRLYRLDEGAQEPRMWEFPFRVSSLALDRHGGAVLATELGIQRLDFATGETRVILDPTAHDPAIFLNDGKCDAQGRFVFGSVHAMGTDDVAALYRLEHDGTITCLDQGFQVTNGPCWSPDGGTFYFADSMRHIIHAYSYDGDSGRVGDRRVFADVSALGGIPDGATVDAEGHVWTAMCDGGTVRRFAPDGSLSLTIDIPTCFVSSVMFGGRDLDRLYVTTIDGAALSNVPAAGGKSLAELSGPEGGALFVVDGLGIRGLPEYRFAGMPTG